MKMAAAPGSERASPRTSEVLPEPGYPDTATTGIMRAPRRSGRRPSENVVVAALDDAHVGAVHREVQAHVIEQMVQLRAPVLEERHDRRRVAQRPEEKQQLADIDLGEIDAVVALLVGHA